MFGYHETGPSLPDVIERARYGSHLIFLLWQGEITSTQVLKPGEVLITLQGCCVYLQFQAHQNSCLTGFTRE